MREKIISLFWTIRQLAKDAMVKGIFLPMEVEKQDYYAAYKKIDLFLFSIHLIAIDAYFFRFSKKAQKAILLHEIAHSKFDEERACDTFVVEAGFGKSLLLFHQEHEAMGFKKYKKSEGLTKKEIQKMINHE